MIGGAIDCLHMQVFFHLAGGRGYENQAAAKPKELQFEVKLNAKLLGPSAVTVAVIAPALW